MHYGKKTAGYRGPKPKPGAKGIGSKSDCADKLEGHDPDNLPAAGKGKKGRRGAGSRY